MSGGSTALRGFDYQATVTLDVLFKYFEEYGRMGRARPEGIDDIELCWQQGSDTQRRYIQIKKPREDQHGKPAPSPWTLVQVVDELLGDTIRHLDGNRDEQWWILGDHIHSAVSTLLDAGRHAPHRCAESYAIAVHLLARNASRVADECSKKVRSRLLSWRPDKTTLSSLDTMSTAYRRFAVDTGGQPVRVEAYCQQARRIHTLLPDILERTSAQSTFGLEHEVASRVMTQLETRYGLDRMTVQRTLFRNLRGFINDISKQHDRWIERDEFELEIRYVWPHMVPVRQPMPLESPHIRRPELVARIATASVHVTEVIGISGSGKSRLATELVEHVHGSGREHDVFYAEVHDSDHLRHTVRDVLAGVAFHLRRMRIDHPFHHVVDAESTEEESIRRVGRALASSGRPVLLIIDLRDGTCSDSFSRDLARLVETCSERFQLVCFGQESALRELGVGERQMCGVQTVEVPGFHFGEFCDLLAHFHPEIARSELMDIYQRVTAGRQSGLYAALGQALARLDSAEAMREAAASSGDNLFREAERRRFARLTEPARRAAATLSCFALPFSRQDAEDAFPQLAIGAALRELRTLGLVEPLHEDRFEMHESIRRGIEHHTPLAIRQQSHRDLASWYSMHSMDTAEIFHLHRAGECERADRKARELFLAGRYWQELVGYMGERHLVTAEELITLLATKPRPASAYLLAKLIARIRDRKTVPMLLNTIRDQESRFDTEHEWAWLMSETAILCGPDALYELLVFALENPVPRIERINFAASRVRVHIDDRLLALFSQQDVHLRRNLVSIFVRDGRRQVLQPVFKFLFTLPYIPQLKPQHTRFSRSRGLLLQFPDRAAVIEFLASLPKIEISKLLLSRSALLDPFTDVVWQYREILGPHCRDLVDDHDHHEPIVVQNALRVLIAIRDRSVVKLCGKLANLEGELKMYATLVPALVPYEVDRGVYCDRITTPGRHPEERLLDLSILVYLGEDIGCYYEELIALEPNKERFWRLQFMLLAAIHPFPLAINLVANELEEIDESLSSPENWTYHKQTNNGDTFTSTMHIDLLAPLLMQLGDLQDPRAVDLLIRALASSHPKVRLCACITLQQHRSPAALEPLLCLMRSETEAMVRDAACIAAIASGLKTVGQLEESWSDSSPKSDLWRAISTARTRDSAQAPTMITMAVDTQRPWIVRRAAILAAGRLSYTAALSDIESKVMSERSPFTLDRNHSLIAHDVISGILRMDEQVVLSKCAQGRDSFAAFFGNALDSCYEERLGRDSDLPSGRQAAEWLYDRLQYHGWPQNKDAAKIVINELHVPILHAGVLRSLRLCGQLERIELYIEKGAAPSRRGDL